VAKSPHGSVPSLGLPPELAIRVWGYRDVRLRVEKLREEACTQPQWDELRSLEESRWARLYRQLLEGDLFLFGLKARDLVSTLVKVEAAQFIGVHLVWGPDEVQALRPTGDPEQPFELTWTLFGPRIRSTDSPRAAAKRGAPKHYLETEALEYLRGIIANDTLLLKGSHKEIARLKDAILAWTLGYEPCSNYSPSDIDSTPDAHELPSPETRARWVNRAMAEAVMNGTRALPAKWRDGLSKELAKDFPELAARVIKAKELG
jgi:hypothetical protein